MELEPSIKQVWDRIFKPCFGQWAKHMDCVPCSLRKACQQADPTVSKQLKKLWRGEPDA